MMSVRVEVLPGLRDIFVGEATAPVSFDEQAEEDSTVGDVIRKLADRHQAFRDVVLDAGGEGLSGQATIVVNERLLESLGGLDTRIRNGDVIRIFPVVAGG